MIHKNLGNTNVKIPAIGQGTAAFRRHPKEANRQIKALRLGIELGMTFIDTAEQYGDGYSEKIVARAIKGIRDKVFLATKVSPEHLSYYDILKSVDGSLWRLKTDYIDLYQIHWPNLAIPISETMGAMERLVRQGKIRFIGLSNYSLSEIKEACSLMSSSAVISETGIVSEQAEYNLFNRYIEDDILPYCQKEGMTVIAHTPLDHWRTLYWGDKGKDLKVIAGKYDKTIAQVALNWLVSKPPVVVIPKASSTSHVRENATATDFNLTSEDIKRIEQIFAPEYVYVSPERVRLNVQNRVDYQTMNEAIENRLGVSPTPVDLAKGIRNGLVLKPISVTPTKDESGEYDLVEGGVRYWAQVIADENKPIKALLRG